MDKEQIFNSLKELQQNSYSRYSNYKVAAIVKTDLGYFKGVNVENAAYPLTLCAEKVAIANAISSGAKSFEELYLLTENTECFGTPCGGCRQVILEFLDKKTKVISFNMNGDCKEFSVEELLPFAWDSSMLK